MLHLFSNFVIPIVLHPRHKLTYFKLAKWENDWIDTAEKLLRDEFEWSYAADSCLVECDGDEDRTVIPSAASVSFSSPNHVYCANTVGRITFSITCLPLPPQTLLTLVAKLTNTSMQGLKMYQTLLLGGTTGAHCILTFLGWLWITSLYLVCAAAVSALVSNNI